MIQDWDGRYRNKMGKKNNGKRIEEEGSGNGNGRRMGWEIAGNETGT